MNIRCNALKRSLAPIWYISLANFESWLHSSKTAVLLFFLIALCFMEVRGTVTKMAAIDEQVYWNEMVFHQLAYGSNIFISTALFFSVMSEIPRRIAAQNNMLIRGTKVQWVAGQMLYMLMLVLAFWFFICMGTVLFSLDRIQLGTGWSDTGRMGSGATLAYDAFIPAVIRNQFLPMEAVLLASLPILMFWYSILITIFLFSLFHYPSLGVVLCAINVYSVMTVGFASIDEKWFIINYSTLNNVMRYDESLASIWSVLGCYLLYFVGLVTVALIAIHHTDMQFNFRNAG